MIVISGFMGEQAPANIPKTGRWKRTGREVWGVHPALPLSSTERAAGIEIKTNKVLLKEELEF